jgi:hypothetical protein
VNAAAAANQERPPTRNGRVEPAPNPSCPGTSGSHSPGAKGIQPPKRNTGANCPNGPTPVQRLQTHFGSSSSITWFRSFVCPAGHVRGAWKQIGSGRFVSFSLLQPAGGIVRLLRFPTVHTPSTGARWRVPFPSAVHIGTSGGTTSGTGRRWQHGALRRRTVGAQAIRGKRLGDVLVVAFGPVDTPRPGGITSRPLTSRPFRHVQSMVGTGVRMFFRCCSSGTGRMPRAHRHRHTGTATGTQPQAHSHRHTATAGSGVRLVQAESPTEGRADRTRHVRAHRRQRQPANGNPPTTSANGNPPNGAEKTLPLNTLLTRIHFIHGWASARRTRLTPV